MNKELDNELKAYIIKYFDNIYNYEFFKKPEPRKRGLYSPINPRYRKLFLQLSRDEQLRFYIFRNMYSQSNVAIKEPKLDLVVKDLESICQKRIGKVQKGTIFGFKCELEDFYRYGVVTYDEKTSVGSALYFYILDYKSAEMKYEKIKITKNELLIPVPYKIEKSEYKHVKILDIVCDIDQQLNHSLKNIEYINGIMLRDMNNKELETELPLHCIHDPSERKSNYIGKMVEQWEKILFKNFDREYLFDLFMNEYQEIDETDQIINYKQQFKDYINENIKNLNFEYCHTQANNRDLSLEILEEDGHYCIDFYWEPIDKIINLLENKDLDQEDFTNIVTAYLDKKLNLEQIVISEGTGQLYITTEDEKVIQKVKTNIEKLVNSKTILNKRVKEYNI